MRVRLGNVNEVDAALQRSFHLKNKAEYKGIYVTRDLTSTQQVENQKRREAYKQQKEEEERRQQQALLTSQDPNIHNGNNTVTVSTLPQSNDNHVPKNLHTSGIKRGAGLMDVDEVNPPLSERLAKHSRRENVHASSPDITAPR